MKTPVQIPAFFSRLSRFSRLKTPFPIRVIRAIRGSPPPFPLFAFRLFRSFPFDNSSSYARFTFAARTSRSACRWLMPSGSSVT